jgi:hypothetical protein
VEFLGINQIQLQVNFMQINMNISPFKLEFKKHEHFVCLHMENSDRSIEVVTLFDTSHINKLHDMLNELYESRANQDDAEMVG